MGRVNIVIRLDFGLLGLLTISDHLEQESAFHELVHQALHLYGDKCHKIFDRSLNKSRLREEDVIHAKRRPADKIFELRL